MDTEGRYEVTKLQEADAIDIWGAGERDALRTTMRRLTPNPTPTRTYVSERRRPVPRARALFGHGSYTLTDISGRKESGSKTAGCRFDSCPICLTNPEFKRPRMNDAKPLLRFQRLIRQLLCQFASD
jgi:hypothetical protein